MPALRRSRALGIAVLLAAPISVFGAAQNPPSAPVTVVNTPANPVPVVQQGNVQIGGSVTISGTPNVNVVNTPTVNVGNSAAAPVLVRDVDRGIVSVFQTNILPYTVPSGKRAIIEYVSRFSEGDATDSDAFFGPGISTVSGGSFTCHLLLVTTRNLPRNQRNDYLAAQVVRIYADAGTKIETCDSFGGVQFFGSLSVSGILVDAP